MRQKKYVKNNNHRNNLRVSYQQRYMQISLIVVASTVLAYHQQTEQISRDIQGDSGGMVNILGEDTTGHCQKISYCDKKCLIMDGFRDTTMGLDSSVGIATRYGLDGPGIESRCGARFSAPVQSGHGVYPASCTMGTGSFSGVKRPGRVAALP